MRRQYAVMVGAAARLLGWLGVLLASSAVARADSVWTFRLVGADERPVVGVSVVVGGANATTDATGLAQVPTPEGPEITIEVGVAPTVRVVVAGPPWPATVQVARPNTTTIVGPRSTPTTASSTRVDGRDLRAIPFRSADDALRLVPGLTLSQHGNEGKGPQLYLRGIDAMHGADFALSLEGIPLNESSHVHAHGMLDLGLVIPETIATIDVEKGPFSLEQGPFAVAGAGAIRLGIGAADRGLRVIYGVGTTNRHRGVVTWTPADGDGQDFVAVEAVHDDGFGVRRAVDRGALSGRVRLWESATTGTWRLLGAAQLADFQVPGLLRDDDVRAGRIGRFGAYDRRMGGTSARGVLSLSQALKRDGLAVTTMLWASARRNMLRENFTGRLLDTDEGDARQQRQRTLQVGLSHAFDVRVARGWRIEGGVAGLLDGFAQTQVPLDLQYQAREADRDVSGIQGLFDARLGMRWQPARNWRLAAGARVDVAHVDVAERVGGGAGEDGSAEEVGGTRAVVSPRVSAAWDVGAGMHVLAAWGRGQRPPEARAFSGRRPETTGFEADVYRGGAARFTTSDNVELGLRWEPSLPLVMSLAVFGTFIARESVFDHVSGLNLDMNATRRMGVEFAVEARPWSWLSVQADATWVDARFVQSGNPVPMAPPLVAGFRAVATHPAGWNAGLRVQVVGPRPLPHGARSGTLVLADLTAGYRWRWLTVELALENVPDLTLREGEYHFASAWGLGPASSAIPALHFAAGPPLNGRLSVAATF